MSSREGTGPKHHLINADYGMIEGDAVPVDSEGMNLRQWLEYRHHVDDETLISYVVGRFRRIAFIDDVDVDPNERGNGYGNELLHCFLIDAAEDSCEVVFLAADATGEQADGFDLVAWYEKWGFVRVHETDSGPIMARPMDPGLDLAADLGAFRSSTGPRR